MEFQYSRHWMMKKRYRPSITDDILEYAIITSPQLKDKHWNDAYNALARISGRKVKAVYIHHGMNHG